MENSETAKNSPGAPAPPRSSATSIRIRCPSCMKLYSVNPGEFTTAQPRFSCTQCGMFFWISYPEMTAKTDFLGIPDVLPEAPGVEVVVAPQERPFSCPKCGAPYSGGAVECENCGVIFSRLRESTTGPIGVGLAASKTLREAWQRVMGAYADQEVHQEFVRACLREDNLAFGLESYTRLLDVSPEDTLARRLRDEFVALMTVPIDRIDEKDWRATGPRERVVPFVVRAMGTLIIFLSTVVLTLGYFLPDLRNLMGLGASLLFLMLALRYYFKVV